MEFFLPGVKPSEYESAYEAIVASVKDQMRWPVTSRRLFRLDYTHDKRRFSLQVGETEKLGNQYEVCAILESNVYMAITRDAHGQPGVTIMVSKDEVTGEEEFAPISPVPAS